MENVAADEAEFALEVEGREDLARDDRRLEARRIGFDRVDHEIGDRLARLVPRAPVRQFRRDMLAEQGRDMLARGAKRIVERRGDQHFDDWGGRPAGQPGVDEGALHIGEARRDHDAAPMMLSRVAPRESGEARQFAKPRFMRKEPEPLR